MEKRRFLRCVFASRRGRARKKKTSLFALHKRKTSSSFSLSLSRARVPSSFLLKAPSPIVANMLRTLAARALAGATASSSSLSTMTTTTAAAAIVASSSSLLSSRSFSAGTTSNNKNTNEADYGLAAGVPSELLNREVRRRRWS